MTPIVKNPSPEARREQSLWRSHTRRDQVFFACMMLVFLAASMMLQSAMAARRVDWNLVREAPDSEKTYRSLAINFPRLILGGFRGILSTILWQQAEEDKNEHRWVELETKYDMIGALQPYFVSVYRYHSWNQAYNLSAQWHEEDTKYKWVLDGLAYLYKGEEYNPGNPDLDLEEGHIYFMKLGTGYERLFYRAHWRADIARLHELNASSLTNSDSTVALKHVREFVNHRDARTGDQYLHITELPDPAKKQAGTGWGVSITDSFLFKGRTDGKAAGDPMEFRYGLSPFYFAYCEYKRCMERGGPTIGGAPTYDAWPAMSLRLWCRDDLYYTNQALIELFGKTPNAALLNDPAKFAEKVAEIDQCQRNVQMIAPRALDEFQAHLARYPGNKPIHAKHILETQAYQEISKAEGKLFDTLVQWQINGQKLNPALIGAFQEADSLYQAAYPVTMKWVDFMYPLVPGQPFDPMRADSEQYATGLKDRSRGIEALLTLPSNQKPDMSFLESEVVEK